MKEGFTTGACAAAAALASCLWRRDGECPPRVEIALPDRAFAKEILPREITYNRYIHFFEGDIDDTLRQVVGV